MKIEKSKLKVNICLKGNLVLSGFVHINPGERLQDFINDTREDFIAVTSVQSHAMDDGSIQYNPPVKRDNVILNKRSIVWIEESLE